VTSFDSPYRPFPIDGPLEPFKDLFVTVSEIFNGECDAMVDMAIRPLNKGQDHIILVPIDFSYTVYVPYKYRVSCQ